ncbi:hypothetical protein HC031_11465 [Planosporangium thailandense]|uniref:DUF1269 domain-containing protein n=1 Tax=Planosporangium thailandense TaxID=765197 RepID=A0ABX0XYT0_9ACTN|nr:hypothetical protein [Planosporangium thailandense]NJC70324.1 hypothetical protein [Planosporangium thailandense]
MTVQPKRPTVDFGTRRGSRTVLTDHAGLAGRTPVASFPRYADAERTLELLAHASFPVHRTALVGGDLKLVGVTDTRVTAVRAAALGGCGGLWVGAMMAVFSVVNGPGTGGLLIRLAYGLPLGALSGVAVGLSAYAILGDTRGGPPHPRLVATRHELHVDAEVAASAWRLLRKLRPSGMTPADRAPAEVVAQPTELVLIETFEVEDARAQPAGRAEPGPAARRGVRPVELPAGATLRPAQ